MQVKPGVLPNLFILGAAKAGTTTLYDILRQHPEVIFSFDKEPMFFSRDDYYNRGLSWYSDTYFKASEKFPIRGEATPHYLYWAEKTAARIHSAYPNDPPKFIIILRNPIDRAYSWYWNMVMEGCEGLAFEAALAAEDDRIRVQWEALSAFGAMTFGYVRGSSYAQQIKSFYKFFSANHFFITLLDDLKTKPENVASELCDFLQIDPLFPFSFSTSNFASKPRSYKLHTFLKNRSGFKDLVKPLLPLKIRYGVKKWLLRSNLDAFSYPPMDEQAFYLLRSKLIPEVLDLQELLHKDLSSWLDKKVLVSEKQD